MISEATFSMESKSTTHVLKGLEADNLLAFLALLGLLDALDTARPKWRTRVAWRGMPPQAGLELAAEVSTDGLLAGAKAGLRMLEKRHARVCSVLECPDSGMERCKSCRGIDLKSAADDFRKIALALRGKREQASLIAALASDGALAREPKGSRPRVEPTSLCAVSGQGHQHFLSRLIAMLRLPGLEADGKSQKPRDGRSGRKPKSETRSLLDELRQALFEPWRYEDGTESFRWDPIEDRRYAYQWGDPSENANRIGTVPGANLLAAFGLAALTSAPTASGLATRGVFRATGQVRVCWPLVAVPTSLAGHVALLSHPWLSNEERAPQLAAYGVLAVARSQRYGVPGAAGTYFNFTRARVQYL